MRYITLGFIALNQNATALRVKSMSTKIITIENAASCSPYELRQELVKRNAFDLEESKVQFKTLLQRLMVELVKDKEKLEEEKVMAAQESAQAVRDAAKAEREEKKRLALEKSKARQADPNYFANRVASNEAAKQKQKAVDEAKKIVDLDARVDGDEEEGEAALVAEADDPFRSYQSKSRSKIFIK